MAIATLSIDLVAKLANLERDMGKAAHIAEKNAARMESAFSGVKKSLAAIGSVLTVGAFAGMVRGVADAGDQLAKLSTRTGIAVEELSKLRYAASLSDISNEDLSTSLGRLNKVLGEAADGSKQATEALARFGIAPGALNASQAFEVIADRVKNTGDQTKIASAMNDIFGRSWDKLVPMIKGGSEGLRDAGDELERMGGVMSGDLAKASEQFNDNITRLNTQLGTLKLETLGPLIPLFFELSNSMVDAADKSDKFADSGSALKTIFETITVLGANVAYVFKQTGAEIGGMAAQLKALSTLDFEAFSNIGEAIKEDAKQARAEIDALSYRLMNPYQDDGYRDRWNQPQFSGDGITGMPAATAKTGRTGSSKVEKFDLSQFDALIKAEESYLQALEGIAAAQESARRSTLGLSEAQSKLLDLQQSDVWATLSAEQRQAAEEQARYADETIQAAESQERLNSLIAGLDSSQIEQAWQDMDLLNQALEAGSVSQAQYSEAVKKLFDGGNEKIKEQKSMAEELGLTFSSAFEDAIVKGEEFSKVLEGIGEDILRILVRKNITEPLAGAVGKFDFGEMFSGFSLPSFAVGTDYVPKDMIAQIHKGEKIVPAKYNNGAGSNVVVNLVEAPGSGKGGSTSTTPGSNGEQIITVLVEKIKGDFIKDVGSGGPFSSALEGQYSLNRSAGAWR